MTEQQRTQVTKIAKEFTKGIDIPINGSGWLVVDPLSGYLNACGFKNTLMEMPKNDKHPQVLIIVFKDGDQFIPSGKDLSPINKAFKNWMWLDK